MVRRVTLALTALATLLGGLASTAAAQCALCREAAAALGKDGQAALDLGILVLLIPAVTIFVGILAWAAWKRNESWGDTLARENPEDIPVFFPTPEPLETPRVGERL